MQIGHLRGFATPRVDHDQMAIGVLADGVDLIASIGEAVRDPRVGTQDKKQIAVFNVFGGVAGLRAKKMAIDPKVTGFFLRQRVEDVS